MNQITEQIWLGDSRDAGDLPGEVNAVLNCALDLPDRTQWPRVRLAHCGLVDGPGNRVSAYYSAVAQLGAMIGDGCKVLVHCHQGRSPSAAVVVFYLAATDPCQRGWDYWLDFVRERRPGADPHEAHRLAFLNLDWLLLHSVVRA